MMWEEIPQGFQCCPPLFNLLYRHNNTIVNMSLKYLYFSVSKSLQSVTGKITKIALWLLYWDQSQPPQIHIYLKSQNVILFGWGDTPLGWARIRRLLCCSCKKVTWRQTSGLCEDGGRNWSEAATKTGKLSPGAGGSEEPGCSLRLCRVWSCQNVNFRHFTARIILSWEVTWFVFIFCM